MQYQSHRHAVLGARSLFIPLIYGLMCVSATGYDLTTFVSTLSPVAYQGESLTYDFNQSGSGEVFFDYQTHWAAPGLIIYDNSSDALVSVWVPSQSSPEVIYEGTDPQAALQALRTAGFVASSTATLGGTGGTTVALDGADGGNIQGAYQVALWIFGGLLMLPIILKVKPG